MHGDAHDEVEKMTKAVVCCFFFRKCVLLPHEDLEIAVAVGCFTR
jgi:hypothetical protein